MTVQTARRQSFEWKTSRSLIAGFPVKEGRRDGWEHRSGDRRPSCRQAEQPFSGFAASPGSV